MGNTDFKISAGRKFAENDPDLSVNFANTTSFGHIWGETFDKSNYEEDLRYNFEKLDLGEASAVIKDDEEIPAVTIKNEKKTEFDPLQFKKDQESQRFIPIQIIDILASTIIIKKPSLFCFGGINYRYVIIAGQVVTKKIIIGDKLNIGVDDGTGCISCIVDHSENELRTDLKQFEETVLALGALNKEEFLKLGEMDDKDFFEKMEDEDKKNAFYITCSRLLVGNIKKDWEYYPVIAEINIGDNVLVMGVVADYKDNKLIFPRYLNRSKDLTLYTKNMIEAIEFKRKTFKSQDLNLGPL